MPCGNSTTTRSRSSERLDVALGDDSGVRRPDQRVLELLFGGLDGGFRRRNPGLGRLPGRQRPIHVALRTEAAFLQVQRPAVFFLRLDPPGTGFPEARLGLLQRRLLLDVGEADQDFPGLDIIVDVVEHLGDAAGGLRRDRGLVHRLHLAVEIP
jgi:hypothetical protein